MQKKLLTDYLKADLESTKSLLRRAADSRDYAGQKQLTRRVERLEHELSEIEANNDARAAITLFFDGEPVVGSHSISASFSSKMLDYFQELLSEDMAVEQYGDIGERGMLPETQSNLMITGVALGSFGFTLEEKESQLIKTPTAVAIERVTDKIKSVASQSESDFGEVLEDLHARELVTLRKFFKTLGTEHATMRLQDNTREIKLDEASIQRARDRVDRADIKEDITSIQCLIFLLPNQKRFEATTLDNVTFGGTVAPKAIETYNELISTSSIHFPSIWEVQMKVRKITPINRPEKTIYRLLDFLRRVDTTETIKIP